MAVIALAYGVAVFGADSTLRQTLPAQCDLQASQFCQAGGLCATHAEEVDQPVILV